MRILMICTSDQILFVIKSRRMIWAGHVGCMRERRFANRVLVGKPEGKMPVGRPRHRWEGNIKRDLQEVGWGSMDWIDLAQNRDRLQAPVNGNEPSDSMNCGEFLD
jgi:hypothetical protein